MKRIKSRNRRDSDSYPFLSPLFHVEMAGNGFVLTIYPTPDYEDERLSDKKRFVQREKRLFMGRVRDQSIEAMARNNERSEDWKSIKLSQNELNEIVFKKIEDEANQLEQHGLISDEKPEEFTTPKTFVFSEYEELMNFINERVSPRFAKQDK